MDARALRERLEQTRKAGARGVDLLYEHLTGHETTVVRGRVHDAGRPTVERLTVRVWLDGGRSAQVSGPSSQVDALVKSAMASAQRAPASSHAGPVARQTGTLGGLGILDRRYETVTPEDRTEVVLQADRSVRQVDRRLTGSGFLYRDTRRLRRFANSRGVLLEETDTIYEAEGTVSASTTSGELALSERIESRTFASIASLPYGTNLARRASDLLEPLVAVAGPVRVLLPPLPTARLFARLAEHFVVRSLGEGAAEPFFLQPLPNGAPAVDPRLHMQDDGTLPGGLRTTSFDDRGVCPISLTLLREGRVDGRFVDPELAHEHDVRPTGHLQDGTEKPRNLLLRSGTRSMNATLADLGGRVLQVDDLPDLSGLDARSGRLMARVNGVVLDSNKPVGAVRGVMLVGELRSVLNQLVEVCSDTDRVGHVDAPGMVLDGFSVEG
jgi:predicted Zn-dependent protease